MPATNVALMPINQARHACAICTWFLSFQPAHPAAMCFHFDFSNQLFPWLTLVGIFVLALKPMKPWKLWNLWNLWNHETYDLSNVKLINISYKH